MQQELRMEILAMSSETALKDLPLLNRFIYEALRLCPPLSQIINRKTSRDVVLGNRICIPEGTYVGYTALGCGRDLITWGRDSEEFRPERWGNDIETINKKYRLAKGKAQMIAFHGGSRACLGEKLALSEIRSVISKMLLSLSWTLDPEWTDIMTPVSRIQHKKKNTLAINHY